MKALVTSKGQITIPKRLREKFGIEPGMEVDFSLAPDGIRLRKVIDRPGRSAVLGCLRDELSGRSVAEWVDEMRGRVEISTGRKQGERP